MEYCFQAMGPQHQSYGELLMQDQRAMKMTRGLWHLSYEKRMRQLGFVSLEKRRLWGDLIVAFW